MDVLSIEEQEDGSAIVTLNMTKKENDILVEYAVIDILKKQLERIDNEQGTSGDNGEVQTDETFESKEL